MSELEIPFALADQWDQMLKTKGHCATYWEIAQWGADQELEACCEWLNADPELAQELRTSRRPKPPSLKEQALAALGRYMTGETILTKDSLDTIHRALEQLYD